MNTVIETIKSRRSVRSYKSDPLPKEVVDTLLEAASYAPSGHNTQPWYFTVIQNKEFIQDINRVAKEKMKSSNVDWMKRMGENPKADITYAAPLLMIVSGNKDAVTYETDCAAAIQNMLLAAESMQVGSVWLGLVKPSFNDPEIRARLSIPEGFEPLYGVAFGYKTDAKPVTGPARKPLGITYVD